jgi:hypothetical protein
MKATIQLSTISNRSRIDVSYSRVCLLFSQKPECVVSRKLLLIGFLSFSLFALVVLAILTTPHALAQCGDNPPDSSCITCHEYQKADPVYGRGEWHDIHASKDCCWNCHGGNTQTQDKDLAHLGMTKNPLEDIYLDCHCCHPQDYPNRAERFAVALGVTPGSSPTCTPIPIGPSVEHSIVILSPSVPNAPPAFLGPLALGGLAFTALFLFALRLIYLHLRSNGNP